MSYPDLRSLIEHLREERDLAVVDVEVDPDLEIAEIHRRVIAAGGPALLFNHPRGSEFPVVTNLFGTRRRAQMAFGSRPLEWIERVVELAPTLIPPTLDKIWGARDVLGALLRVGSRTVMSGPVLDVVTDEVDLGRLPVLKTWAGDGGPFVTLPLVYTEHPETRIPNLGIYRLQVHDRRTTGMHWQIGKGGGFHYAVAEADEVPLPVTVFLGGPPAMILAAIAPLPENVPELLLASLIAGERLGMCDGP
ncbi:MAG: UbiD family decarboxylase, partial [Acidobacteriota bacterium]|nr:UbiD family decarboxylase [Acidobacteriota bacterium]